MIHPTRHGLSITRRRAPVTSWWLALLVGAVALFPGLPAPADDAAPPVAPAMGDLPPLPPDLAFDLPPDIPGILAGLPVQEGGQVKPLATFARFALLRLNARTSLTVEAPGDAKTRLDSMTWLCECLFHP
ncbi:MAG TPA: hypothetical protein PK379_14120, partial [Candidatus Hydrogenedentes bacterium]|nr:hypothetical protein [Candidatus Hydrogenedentota bacterium]